MNLQNAPGGLHAMSLAELTAEYASARAEVPDLSADPGERLDAWRRVILLADELTRRLYRQGSAP